MQESANVSFPGDFFVSDMAFLFIKMMQYLDGAVSFSPLYAYLACEHNVSHFRSIEAC